MQLFVVFFLPLVFDILPDHSLSRMRTNGAYIVTICPKFTIPQLLLDGGHSGKYFSCDQTFDHRDDFGWTLGRYGLHKKMPMILSQTNFEKLYVISSCYF